MSFQRKAFLIWWTAIVLFVAIYVYIDRGMVAPVTYDASFFAGLGVVIFAFGSWIPGAVLRLLWP